MAKTSVDDLLATIAAVRMLQDVVRKQEEAISIILDRLDALERSDGRSQDRARGN